MENLLLKEQYCLHKEKVVDIIDFYDNATLDYKFWSKDFNMHFGFYDPFRTNPFKRNTMLNEMNGQVLKRLKLTQAKALLADLGCGMGGFMTYALRKNQNLSAIGLTLSEFQVNEGNKLLEGLNAVILKEDYNDTSLPSNSCDGAVAMESFCHSGHDEFSFLEAHRILKPGGKLVIADAFLKREAQKFRHTSSLVYSKLCKHWGLEKLGNIQKVALDLKKVGFRKVMVEDISLRVAPSVFHVPFAIIGFIFKELWENGSLKKESLHNLKGSFYALLSGLHLKSFGYYIITCTK